MIDTKREATEADIESATRRRNRNRILDATKELLTEGQRFTKLSINRIAQTAGVSRAAFYLHFQSKSDLIAGLAKRETDRWIESATPALVNASIKKDGLQQLAWNAIALFRDNRGALAGIIEMAEYDDQTRAAWRETIHGIARLFQIESNKIARRSRWTRLSICHG